MHLIKIICLVLTAVLSAIALDCDNICKTDPLGVNFRVCGSNGKTYSSECALLKSVCSSKETVTIVSAGPCKAVGSKCLTEIDCDLTKSKVCASDGLPYFNECAMRKHACKEKKAKVAVSAAQQQCSKANCPKCGKAAKKPVCGSDQKTYNSLCELRAQACKEEQAIIVLKEGRCGEEIEKGNGAEPFELDFDENEDELIFD